LEHFDGGDRVVIEFDLPLETRTIFFPLYFDWFVGRGLSWKGPKRTCSHSWQSGLFQHLCATFSYASHPPAWCEETLLLSRCSRNRVSGW